MSDSLPPHGLYSPWNYLGQNTGEGSLSLLQGIVPTLGLNPCLSHCRRILYQLSDLGRPRNYECESESSDVSDSLQPHGLHSPWNSPAQNSGVGSLSLLQGIVPTQGLNPGLPHCRQIFYCLNFLYIFQINVGSWL